MQIGPFVYSGGAVIRLRVTGLPQNSYTFSDRNITYAVSKEREVKGRRGQEGPIPPAVIPTFHKAQAREPHGSLNKDPEPGETEEVWNIGSMR